MGVLVSVLVSGLATIIAIAAFILSIIQFRRESSRQQKESTLNAYNELQEKAFSVIKKCHISESEKGSAEWDEITRALAHIENFCVGINTEIYSLTVLNKLGGGFFIHQYEALLPVIDKKRENETREEKHYDEFESVVRKLKEERNK